MNKLIVFAHFFLFSQTILAQNVQPFELIISEIMADPTPVVGLPNAEWIEIHNRSNRDINLAGLTISSGSAPQVLPSFILPSKGFVVICDDSQLSNFSSLGPVVAVTTFPALTNTGDEVILQSGTNIIHRVDYLDDWYGDAVKSQGGWTLELNNPENVCAKGLDSWKASNDPLGGTPSRSNSLNLGVLPFQLDSFRVQPTDKLILYLNQSLSQNVGNTPFSVGITLPNQVLVSANRTSIEGSFNGLFSGNNLFKVNMGGVVNCLGKNLEVGKDTFSFKLPIPILRNSFIENKNTLVVKFSLPIQRGLEISNVKLMPGNINPIAIEYDTNDEILRFVFANSFSIGVDYELNITRINSKVGTFQNDLKIPFLFFEQRPISFQDLIINEIMVDPTPIIGLPNAEFIELFNSSANIIDLGNLSLVDDKNVLYPIPSFLLKPNSFVILYKTEVGIDFSNFGDQIRMVKFPSPANEGGIIAIRENLSNNNIDVVDYSISSYLVSGKSEGGWSLERNIKQLCAYPSLWRASANLKGGTPGAKNSYEGDFGDFLEDNFIIGAKPINSSKILVTLSESLPDNPFSSGFIIRSEPDLGTITPEIAGFSNNQILLNLQNSMVQKVSYSIQFENLKRCTDLVPTISFSTGIPESPEKGDLVVNEILYRPEVGEGEFIEIYNESSKVILLEGIQVANLNPNTNSVKKIEIPTVIMPNAYFAISNDPNSIKRNFEYGPLGKSELPSLTDDGGNVSLLFQESAGKTIILDSVIYNPDFQFSLLSSDRGVSLERIDPKKRALTKENWQSAAESVKYGTPGLQNSQFNQANIEESEFTARTKRVSPDQDGFEDVFLVDYNLETGGQTVRVRIFDSEGVMVSEPYKNSLLGSQGILKWDGTNEAGSIVPPGFYIFAIEKINPSGTVFNKRILLTVIYK
jgi:hypothetical protein